jgi:aldose 1-epimerase
VGLAKASWGYAPDGRAVDIFTLRNQRGMQARITNYGGIVVSLTAPDRAGRYADIVLGFDTLNEYSSETYLAERAYFGAIIGRCANRIANSQFELNGQRHVLSSNDGAHHLHGGVRGFDKVVWRARASAAETPRLKLAYTSVDGEEGYPGRLAANVWYTVTENNELRIDYAALAKSSDTVANMTNHSYFNLGGHGENDILDHELEIFSDHFTPLGPGFILTGELRPVSSTAFDFTRPTSIRSGFSLRDQQIEIAKGYAHYFALRRGGESLALAARVFDPHSGRRMEVWTTSPGVQLYTGNFLSGAIKGKDAKPYRPYGGLCLEAQGFPDAVNNSHFPSPVIRAGEIRRSTTLYRFA